MNDILDMQNQIGDIKKQMAPYIQLQKEYAEKLRIFHTEIVRNAASERGMSLFTFLKSSEYQENYRLIADELEQECRAIADTIGVYNKQIEELTKQIRDLEQEAAMKKEMAMLAKLPKDELTRRTAQFEIIQKTNPAYDDFHTHIRKISEVKSWKEVFDDNEEFSYPDNQFLTGEEEELNVYSSYEIKPGTFVSTSKVMAGEYAGFRPDDNIQYCGPLSAIHPKKVKPTEIAWISRDEGIYTGECSIKNGISLQKRKQLTKKYEKALCIKEKGLDL